MLQSYGRWGGREADREQLNTDHRSSGTPDKSPGSSWNTETEDKTGITAVIEFPVLIHKISLYLESTRAVQE